MFSSAWAAMPTAMGPMAAMVPMEVPMAVEMKQLMRNTPGTSRAGGMTLRPRSTTESLPPMTVAADWKPPASR